MKTRLSNVLVAGWVALAVGPSTLLGTASINEAVTSSRTETFTLTGAELRKDASDASGVRLVIPGYREQPRLQVLENPLRVVVDLHSVIRSESVDRKCVQALSKHPLVKKARLSQYAMTPEPVTRVVFEVQAGTQVEALSASDGIHIVLLKGTGQTKAAYLNAPVKSEPVLAAATPVAPAPIAEAPLVQTPVAALAAVSEPAKPMPALPVLGMPFQALPQIAGVSLAAAAPAPMKEATQREEPYQLGKTLGDGETRYTGSKFSVDVKGTDLSSFLRLLADHAKLNLIVDPEVQGISSDFKFTDTPWDLVLDTVLKQYGFGKEINSGIIRVARVKKLQDEERDRKDLDEAKALAGELQSVTRPLSFAKASEAKGIVERVLTKRGSIIVDDRTNTLILTDLPRNLKVIDELISQLDVPIQQVQIEARVVEAAKDFSKAMGVRWPTNSNGDTALTITKPDGTSGAAPWVSSNGKAYNSINNLSTGGTSAMVGFAPGKDGVTSIPAPAGEFWVSFLSNRMSVNFILQAAEKNGTVKIVSNPKVVTQNNKKASILSGEKIPFPSQQGGAQGGAITVQFVDANLELDVTPQITHDGTILMDLKIEKAEADFSRQVQGTPTILRKSISTQVLVKDGGTAILGGVYVNTNSRNTTGVPFLSKLPLLGWMFRNKDDKDSSNELLIFITPRILKN